MIVAFVPLYIKFLGIESYGLIGLFATLQTVLVIFDMGLSATMNRETARLSTSPGGEQEMRNLTRSLEVIYWSIAIFIGITVIAIAPFIAYYWIKTEQLSAQTIEQALLIMGFAVALQWPATFYTGGLRGLQKQVLLNVVIISMSTLSGAGAVLILWFISPTIQAFFLWQIIISGMNTGLLAWFLWHSLPRTGDTAAFQKQLLTGVWRFAAGMFGIGTLSTILTQLDKIILSKMLTLEMFGYYTLAGVVAMSLYGLISPVYSAIYPRFTQLVTLGDQDGLKQLYHKSCQLMSVLIFPVTVVVAMFSYEILLIWTQDSLTAEKAHLLVSILICGTALNGLMSIPGSLQFANGWTKLALYGTLIAVIIIVPLIVCLTSQYGAIGGAIAWVILNTGNVFIMIPVMHKRLLVTEKWRWYWQDNGLPLVASLIIAGLGRLFIGGQMSQVTTAFYLIIISISTLAVTAMVTPTTRTWFRDKILRLGRE
jgi:O-antigen/teichoic acid export membrane protein